MKTLQALKIIRTIVNAILGDENLKETPTESRLKGIAWSIQKILIEYNINEN